jgi:2-polyprenyl-3-methyl-5-hydroxy-6-metoxy-1,4-benzoquinol methylase
VIKRRFVEAYTRNGRLLDVGCATGTFIGHMAARGWEVEGVEVSSEAAQLARDRHGVHVHTGRLAEADIAPGSTDVVTLWDVIEHVHNPPAELAHIRELLVRDGLLVLTVPNLASWDRRLFGVHWIGWDLPRHLYGFPATTLERMVAEAGFRLVERRCILSGVGAFVLSYRNWAAALEPSFLQRALLSLTPAIAAAIWPYKELAYRRGRGPVETIACIRR